MHLEKPRAKKTPDGVPGVVAIKERVRVLMAEIEACTDGDQLSALVNGQHETETQYLCAEYVPDWYHGSPGVEGLHGLIARRTREFLTLIGV